MNEYPISPEPSTVHLHSNLWWNIRRSPFILLRLGSSPCLLVSSSSSSSDSQSGRSRSCYIAISMRRTGEENGKLLTAWAYKVPR
jgi:hypothetical protein